MRFAATSDPGLGFTFQNEDALMQLTSTTCLRGDVMVVDISVINATTLRYTNMKAPAAADIATASGLFAVAIFGVALEDQPTSGGRARFRFMGEVEALITGTPAAGTLVMANTSRQLAAATASVNSGTWAIAQMREVGVSGALKRVFFDGIHKMGQVLTNTT